MKERKKKGEKERRKLGRKEGKKGGKRNILQSRMKGLWDTTGFGLKCSHALTSCWDNHCLLRH